MALRPEQATIPPGHAWNRLPVIGAVCACWARWPARSWGGESKQFFFSWLVSFLFFLSLALGALFFVLIQYATQGEDGIVVRRIGETVFATVPVMAALFVPLLLGLHDLLVVARRGRRQGCTASLEGAIPQRAVLPDPGALPEESGPSSPFCTTAARAVRTQGDPGCRPGCAASPGPPSSSSR